MKGILLLLLACVSAQLCGKSYFAVTPSTRVSLITASPSQDLYSSFGHSAIRVRDTLAGFDIAFNYGAFDFDQPGFYAKFVRGKLLYSIVIVRTDTLLASYVREGRRVTENLLLLDSSGKQKLFDYLMWNSEIENREYSYNFFYNNCSTKLRNLLETQLDSALLNYSDTAFARDATLRSMLDGYLGERPWTGLCFSLLLGTQSDERADGRMQTFLPRYLQVAVRGGSIGGRAIAEGDRILCASQQPSPRSKSISPTVFIPAALLAFFVCAFWRGWRWRAVAALICLLTGLAGFAITFMWVGTDHDSTKGNLNILWAFPWNVAAAALLFKKRFGTPVFQYLRAYGIWLAFLSLASFALPQPFHPAVRLGMAVCSGALLLMRFQARGASGPLKA